MNIYERGIPMNKKPLLRVLSLLLSLLLLSTCIAFSEEGAPPIDTDVYETDIVLGQEALAAEASASQPAEAEAVVAEPAMQPMEISNATPLVVTSNGDIYMGIGEQRQILLIEDVPTGFRSSKEKIASVNESGLLTAQAKGKTKVYVTTAAGKKYRIVLRVVDPKEPASVGITQGGVITLEVGQSLQLTALAAPDTAVTTFTWKTSKKSVATVSADGIVSALSEGSAKVTVKTANGKKATTRIDVIDPNKPSSVGIAQGGEITLEVGQSLQLTPILSPDTARTAYTWKTSKKSVATVSAEGVVTALRKGIAKITVRTSNKKKATTLIHVVDSSAPVVTPEPAPVVTPEPVPVVTPEPAPEPTPAIKGSYELFSYLGKSFDLLNSTIPDKLAWNGSEYSNAYLSVEVDSAGTITKIRLDHSIPLSAGGDRYQLFNLSPNMILSEHDWTLRFAWGKPVLSTAMGKVYKSISFPSQSVVIVHDKNELIWSIAYGYDK